MMDKARADLRHSINRIIYDSNTLTKLIKKQGGPNGIDRFLKGELVLTEAQQDTRLEWYEDDGVIYFNTTFTSDGTTGEGWIQRFSNRESHVSPYFKNALLSQKFKPTDGVSYKVAMLKGSLFNDNERIPQIIDYEARRRGLKKPHLEVSCLVKEYITKVHLGDIEFGGMISMHEHDDGFGRLLRIQLSTFGLVTLRTEAILHFTDNFLYVT